MQADKTNNEEFIESHQQEVLAIIDDAKLVMRLGMLVIPFLIAGMAWEYGNSSRVISYLIFCGFVSSCAYYIWYSESARNKISAAGFPKYSIPITRIWVFSVGSLPFFDIGNSHQPTYLLSSVSSMWGVIAGLIILYGMFEGFAKPVASSALIPGILAGLYHGEYPIAFSSFAGIILIYLAIGSSNTSHKRIVRSKVIAEKRVDYESEAARTDWLTGLLNRYGLFEAAAEETQQYKSVLFLDLDGFKNVNDTAGHETGDELLKSSAKRLSNLTKETDLVSRLGGDEFVVVTNISDYKSLKALSERILKKIEEPFILNNQTFQLSASIGISIATEDFSIKQMLNSSDLAMLSAKKQGKGRVHLHRTEQNEFI